MKVIPAIDLMNGQVVRLYKGDPNQKTIYSNDPISIAKQWEEAGADLIHLVDLDATLGLGTNFELIKKIVSSVSIPVEIAGGLRSESLILEALEIVDRVVIGTFAFKEPELLQNLLTKLGPEKIVISVDHKDGIIVTHGWQSNTDISLIDLSLLLDISLIKLSVSFLILSKSNSLNFLSFLNSRLNSSKSFFIFEWDFSISLIYLFFKCSIAFSFFFTSELELEL